MITGNLLDVILEPFSLVSHDEDCDAVEKASGQLILELRLFYQPTVAKVKNELSCYLIIVANMVWQKIPFPIV